MSTTDVLFELGKDLLAFARDPEEAVGIFRPLPFPGTSLLYGTTCTGRWIVMCPIDETSVRTYTWHKLKGSERDVEHSLEVQYALGWISRLTLTCKISGSVTYEVVYAVERDRLTTPMETSHQIDQIDTKSLLGKVPPRMTPSSFKPDLASV